MPNDNVHVHPNSRGNFLQSAIAMARTMTVSEQWPFLRQRLDEYGTWMERLNLPPDRVARELAVMETAFLTLLPPPRGQAKRAHA